MGNLSYPDRTYFQNYKDRKIKIITFSMLSQAFSKYQQNNLLTFQNFNECLKLLLSDENFPIIQYTYLSEKLFRLIDKNNNGVITSEQFTKGMCMALSCLEQRVQILFEAMKSNINKNYLTFEEVYQFFLNSWIAGFNYIFGYINYYFKNEFNQKNIPVPSSRDEMMSIINRHKEDLHNYLVKNLYESGINSNAPISYEMFKNWVLKDNTLEINYGNKLFRFATSILYFENIGLNIQA